MRYELSERWKKGLGRASAAALLAWLLAACSEPLLVEEVPVGEDLVGAYTSHFEGVSFTTCDGTGPMWVRGDASVAQERIRELGGDPHGAGGTVYVRLRGEVVPTPTPFDPDAYGSRGNGFGDNGRYPLLLVLTKVVVPDDVVDTRAEACGA